MLKANSITLTYDSHQSPVIQSLDLTIQHGSFIGLIGANGAGKSTLLLGLSGQFRPVQGHVQFNDKDIYHENRWYKRQIGFVHEHPFFYDHMKVGEFLQFVALVKGIGTSNTEREIDQLLQAVRLKGEQQKLTSALSLGMRKKLAIASAFLGQPKIVFLDEAMNGVDMESAFHIKTMLREYVRNGGAVILSTHVLEVIEKTCDRFILLKNGRIVGDIQAESRSDLRPGDFEAFILKRLQEA